MKRLLMLLAATALTGAPAAAQTIAITNGKVAIGDGSAPIENGTVVIRNGRIVAAGANVAIPGDAQRVDAQGRWVTPGLVAGWTNLGLIEVDAVKDANDTAADNSPFSAAIDVAPAINAEISGFPITRSRGVTRAIVAPDAGNDIFGGQGALVDTGEDDESVFAARAFQFVELGETGARKAGGSRAATHVFFRNAMMEARDYARNPAGYGGRDSDALLMRLDAAALVPVVEGRMPLLVHVERASDIVQVLKLREEFPALKLVLVGASEGWMVADKIAAAKVPVLTPALTDLPYAFEALAATQSNYGRLKAAGVKVAIGDLSGQPRNTKQSAGNLVALQKVPGATGVSWDAALASITSAPAEVMGMGGDFGSLRAGRRGDVVIWDGDPLELGFGADPGADRRGPAAAGKPPDQACATVTARPPRATCPRPIIGERDRQPRAGDRRFRRHPFADVAPAAGAPRRAAGREGLCGFLFAGRVRDPGLDDPGLADLRRHRAAVDRSALVVAGGVRADAGREHPSRRVADRQSGLSQAGREGAADRRRDRRVRDHPPPDELELPDLGLGPPLAVGQPAQPDRRRRHPDPRLARLDRSGPQEARFGRRDLARLGSADRVRALRGAAIWPHNLARGVAGLGSLARRHCVLARGHLDPRAVGVAARLAGLAQKKSLRTDRRTERPSGSSRSG